MAVRNDFSSGEVLTAADLNDTFASKADYPSGGSDGDVLSKSGTTTAWVSASAAGMVLVTSDTFSAVSSVSVNGCFTSDYRDYRITFTYTPTAAQEMLLRMRASGTDTTGSSYGSQRVEAAGAAASGFNALSANAFRIGYAPITHDQFAIVDLLRPQLADQTDFHSSALRYASAAAVYVQESVGKLDDSTQYDGFTLLVGSGTITGTLKVYGYAN